MHLQRLQMQRQGAWFMEDSVKAGRLLHVATAEYCRAPTAEHAGVAAWPFSAMLHPKECRGLPGRLMFI